MDVAGAVRVASAVVTVTVIMAGVIMAGVIMAGVIVFAVRVVVVLAHARSLILRPGRSGRARPYL
ncbi:hypothetical protein [Methylobacterium terrae]|uniref:hypothetical protein n=1 Tax=Methylobacterium terrae TaxID=2202827 RepID=UPI001FE203FC